MYTLTGRGTCRHDGIYSDYEIRDSADVLVAIATMHKDGSDEFMMQRHRDGLVLAGRVTYSWLLDFCKGVP